MAERINKDGDRVAIPLVEESLSVSKREVQTGRVRVRTVPEERTEHVSERLIHTEAAVERIPIDREIDVLPNVREEGDTVIVPVVEERLVKRLFLVEEIRLTRHVVTETLDQPVQLRSQRAVIERDDADGSFDRPAPRT